MLLLLACLLPLGTKAQMTSFKFDNKHNHRLYTDAEGQFDGDTIRLTVACIGTWLTPSFTAGDDDIVYVNDVMQQSKVSRLSFREPVTYHVVNSSTQQATDYVVKVDFLADHPTGDYGVPTIYIETSDGKLPTSKNTYKDATIRIDGGGVFPDMAEVATQIRGRGNSSWISSDKKPYRLKFAEKQKPFGLTKGKSWVLLANNQSKSALSNAIAMELAGQVGTVACNHIVPCELYINNQYRGLYNFTENPSFGNNSIDLDDESRAVLLELDSYYDESYKFKDSYYNVCTNVKKPDFDDPESTALTFLEVKTHYNDFCQVLHSGNDEQFQQRVDVTSVAKARFVTELTRNTEVKHPKSWKLYNADITASDSPYVFGPVWDFDWAYGYDGTGEYYKYYAESDLFQGMGSWDAGYPYFKQLFRAFDSIKCEYYRLWVEWNSTKGIEELSDFIDCYYQYVAASLAHNKTKWHDNTDYAAQKEIAKQWLKKRADYLFSKADVYDLSGIEQVKDDEEWASETDIYDLNGHLIKHHASADDIKELKSGLYVIGKKIVVKE